MDALALIKRLLAQREFKVELGDGLAVTVRRPAEAELADYLRGRHQAQTHLRCVVGWSGFSEATLFGAAVGSSDPLPFDADLWHQVAVDRMDWVNAIAKALGDAITQHGQQRGAEAKN